MQSGSYRPDSNFAVADQSKVATIAVGSSARMQRLFSAMRAPTLARRIASTRREGSTTAGHFVEIDLSSIKGRHFDSLASFTAAEVKGLLELSAALKSSMRGPNGIVFNPLLSKTMSMIFQKRSTRTRVSTESGMAKLGGHALFLASDDIQLGKNESLKDTAIVLSRMCDVLLARVYDHQDILTLCKESSVPVINALSDQDHPLQGLADLLTIQEAFKRAPGASMADLTLSWVGDGNNIAQTFLTAAPLLGFSLKIASPKGYTCNPVYLERARSLGASVLTTHEPREALNDADVVATDTWVSMGQEEEKAKRIKAFQGYQVTESLVNSGGAKKHWKFLHCLPRKPEEVDDATFYHPERSLVWDEAENRMWTVMAVILAQLQGVARVPLR